MNSQRFIIAGERRSGSTTLYEVLKQHPEISMLEQSDFDFFIEPELFAFQAPEKPINSWEDNHSANQYNSIFKDLEGVVGYKDADLLWYKKAHLRIKDYCKNDKFIFVLREPIKRAESQYINELRKGRETLGFEEAIKRDANKLSDWEQLHLQYKERGCYASSLEAFMEYIPKEQVKVVILEELFDNWQSTLEDICEFLGVNKEYAASLRKVHSNKEPFYIRKQFAKKGLFKFIIDIWERLTEAIIVRVSKNKDVRRNLRYKFRFFYQESFREKFTIDSEIIKELQDYYTPYNEALEQMVEKRIPYWKYD